MGPHLLESSSNKCDIALKRTSEISRLNYCDGTSLGFYTADLMDHSNPTPPCVNQLRAMFSMDEARQKTEGQLWATQCSFLDNVFWFEIRAQKTKLSRQARKLEWDIVVRCTNRFSWSVADSIAPPLSCYKCNLDPYVSSALLRQRKTKTKQNKNKSWHQ